MKSAALAIVKRHMRLKLKYQNFYQSYAQSVKVVSHPKKTRVERTRIVKKRHRVRANTNGPKVIFAPSITESTYKFILEPSLHRGHSSERYGDLKGYITDITSSYLVFPANMAAKAAEGIEAMSCARPMETYITKDTCSCFIVNDSATSNCHTDGHNDPTSMKDENEDSDEDEDKDEEGANVEAGAPGGDFTLVFIIRP